MFYIDMIRNGSFESGEANIQSLGRVTQFGIDHGDGYGDQVP